MDSENNTKILEPAFLVEADNYTKGCRKVIDFLDKTTLVDYDKVKFDSDMSCSALDPKFWAMLESGLDKNRQSMNNLIDELQKSGYSHLLDLAGMKQGYESKLLHILVHLLDGFIGMDSSFYNLIEDSHQISGSLHLKIKQTPENYWILQINAENVWTLL